LSKFYDKLEQCLVILSQITNESSNWSEFQDSEFRLYIYLPLYCFLVEYVDIKMTFRYTYICSVC